MFLGFMHIQTDKKMARPAAFSNKHKVNLRT